ncbi:MAG: competence/damage-inducible protein A [Planctomycetes bacterium]|nr:competence/damage-inducible protein A [Planctomycetota bacterium]
MKAEIINTGTELFFDEITNINLAYLSNRLVEIGYEPVFHTTVPDNLDHLISALHTALKRADLIIVTGGLGPTSDDLTRFAVSLATKRELCFNALAYKTVTSFFDKLKIPVPPINRIQAKIPDGASVIPNCVGTAPGFWLKMKGKIIIALPGVPLELKDMCRRNLTRILSFYSPKARTLLSDKFLLFGISESHLQEHINNLELPEEIVPSMTAANNGVISLRLFISKPVKSSASYEASAKLLNRAVSMTKGVLGKVIFGIDEDTLEGVVARMLIDRRRSLSVAESCTGGLLSHKLTKISGVSKVFKEGMVCYSNESKINRLAIPRRIINRYGAVSEEVASLMARNIARLTKSNLGVGVTGIAGPDGGTPEKPVGLVYIAINSGARSTADRVLHYRFFGPRIMIQERSAATALNLLRLRLLQLP